MDGVTRIANPRVLGSGIINPDRLTDASISTLSVICRALEISLWELVDAEGLR